MMHNIIKAFNITFYGCFSCLNVTKRPPLKESRLEIPRKKGKGRDTSDEDLLRSPMLPLYRNDETITL